MWSQLPARNLIHLQRMAWLAAAQREIKELHEDGYSVEVDCLLDELNERIRSWNEEDRQ